MEIGDRYWLSLAIMGLAYVALHWFAWWRRLKRLEAYTIGVATMFAGIAIWLGLDRCFLLLAAYPIVAGCAVGLCYAIDLVNTWRAGARTALATPRLSNSAASREVRTLEDALFTLPGLIDELDVVAMRLGQRARTDVQCADLEAIARVKVRLEQVRCVLLDFHPDRLSSTT